MCFRKSTYLCTRNREGQTIQPKRQHQHRGVEQLVARQAHNLEVVRSSRAPATIKHTAQHEEEVPNKNFFFWIKTIVPKWWNGRHEGLKIPWALRPCGFEPRFRYKDFIQEGASFPWCALFFCYIHINSGSADFSRLATVEHVVNITIHKP